MGHRWVGCVHHGLDQDSALKNLAPALRATVVSSTVSVCRDVKTEIPAKAARSCSRAPANRALTPGAVILGLDACAGTPM